MEDILSEECTNCETDFVHNSGVNNGFTSIPNKLNYCYFLNQPEKSLYGLIRSFVYGDKRSCYPSIEKLMAYSGWSRKTLKKHLKSLEQKELLLCVPRQGTTNVYELTELNKCPIIVHSELLHKIRVGYFQNLEKKFHTLKDQYMETNLYKEVSRSVNPLYYTDVINQWFLSDEKQQCGEQKVIKYPHSVVRKRLVQTKQDTTQIKHTYCNIKTKAVLNNNIKWTKRRGFFD
ncbi:helix-turn-helix domain-containing protein [Cytobacillus sp. Hm23]